jgi:glycosyltransferase involved in cell wall biosynthesis
MMTTRVDQFIPVLDPGDAASNHTRQVQMLLQSMGFDSEIFTEQTHADLVGLTRPFEDHRGGPVLYQFAIGSRMADRLLEGSGALAVNHHNVTPARYFEIWDPPLVHGTAWGQRQLERLARRCDRSIAVSRFNALELREAGFDDPVVAPILFDPASLDRDVDDAVAIQLAQRPGPAWLFVGRLVPNKAQHHLIAALATYRRFTASDAELWLVGGASSPRYERALRSYAAALGLADAVRFTGPLSSAALGAYYRSADVFVCASEHEGFCVPLLEAMHSGLPIVAVDAGAVGETLGTGGLLVPESDPVLIASAVERVVHDAALRARLVGSGHRRLDDFSLARSTATMRDALAPWLARVA